MTADEERAAVEREGLGVGQSVGRGVRRIIKRQGVLRSESGDHTRADGRRAARADGAAAAEHHGALGDREGAESVGGRERQRVVADLGEEEGPGNRTREGDVAAGRTAAGGVDPVGTDAGGTREGDGPTEGGGACGGVDQGTEGVARGGEVGAARAGNRQKLGSAEAIKVNEATTGDGDDHVCRSTDGRMADGELRGTED